MNADNDQATRLSNYNHLDHHHYTIKHCEGMQACKLNFYAYSTNNERSHLQWIAVDGLWLSRATGISDIRQWLKLRLRCHLAHGTGLAFGLVAPNHPDVCPSNHSRIRLDRSSVWHHSGTLLLPKAGMDAVKKVRCLQSRFLSNPHLARWESEDARQHQHRQTTQQSMPRHLLSRLKPTSVWLTIRSLQRLGL